MVEARNAAAGAVGQPDFSVLDLTCTALAAQLAHDLNNLRNTGGANWVTL